MKGTTADTTIHPVIASILLTLLLCLSFNADSLWTDEAFSAFVACHTTLSSFWHSLRIGDSSDLQMLLYYGYLHYWVRAFGEKELTLRLANLPFIFIYAATIVWIRNHLFRSKWVWIAAVNPFVWAYAADTRPYICVLALSTVFVTCLVALVTDPRQASSRKLPWLGLIAILVGANLHMLMLLAVAPAFAFVWVYRRANNSPMHLRMWIRPSLALSPLFAIYTVFLLWTFGRGTDYDYTRPEFLSMSAVLFRFLGLAGFAPNRHYDTAFGPYLTGMIVASICLLSAIALLLAKALFRRDARTMALAAAVAVGIAESIILSLLTGKQIEVRHLTCLFPFFLLMLFSAWEALRVADRGTIIVVTSLTIFSVWLLSDLRLTFLPEYKREDFRGAVLTTLKQAATDVNSEIAVVADPAAAAYYGLAMKSNYSCYPLVGSCQSALSNLPWTRVIGADLATFWSPEQIDSWMQSGSSKKRILLISRGRYPTFKNSYWWEALRSAGIGNRSVLHGFVVYYDDDGKY